MGWRKYFTFGKWDRLSPFRVTPSWKEGVESKYGKWVSSKTGAYHWEKETGKFIKVAGDLFYEFDPDETESDSSTNHEIILANGRIMFYDDPCDVGDNYGEFEIVTSTTEYNKMAVYINNESYTQFSFKMTVAKKKWQVYKYKKGDWVFVKKDKNPN